MTHFKFTQRVFLCIVPSSCIKNNHSCMAWLPHLVPLESFCRQAIFHMLFGLCTLNTAKQKQIHSEKQHQRDWKLQGIESFPEMKWPKALLSFRFQKKSSFFKCHQKSRQRNELRQREAVCIYAYLRTVIKLWPYFVLL